MQYRRFGRTELNMPLISVGGMRYQTSWKREDPIKTDSIANLEKIVAHAVELGLYHFETAHGYGTSEAELGPVLANYNRDKLIIQTKGTPEKTLKEFLDNLKVSMRCLKVDRLDLFAVHGINNDEILQQALQKGGVVDAALKLKAQGVIGALGFSTHGPADTIIKAIRTGVFDYVNLWYSYINQSNIPAIREANKQDMGVFIISPNDKGGQLYKPSEKLCRLTTPLSPMTFNDIFILQNRNIHTISCGASKPSDFDEHVNAIESIEHRIKQVQVIEQRLNQALESVIDVDWARRYTEGLPECSETPGGMNIAVILWLWNLIKAFDMQEYAQERFNLMGNAEHWFPGCKADFYKQIDKNQLRESLTNSPYPDLIMNILEEIHELLVGEEVKRLSQE
jgi:predicted aldo/keto reductase-like oxidoreductase